MKLLRVPAYRCALTISILALSASVAASCSDDPFVAPTFPPTPPTGLRVITVTRGVDLPNGYVVHLSGEDHRSVSVGANATTLIPGLLAGTRSVALGGIAANCTFGTGSFAEKRNGYTAQTVTITRGVIVDVIFGGNCEAFGHIVVTVATTGIDPDPNGYVLRSSPTYCGPLAQDGKSLFPCAHASPDIRSVNSGILSVRVAGGEHVVSLTDVAANCDVTPTNPLLVPAVSSDTVPAAYNVVCAPVTRLAYTSSTGDIYAIDSNGSRVLRLTETAQEDDPEWSPDGRKIAFTSLRDVQADIYVMEADGSNEIRLTSDAAADYQPAWSPDGRRIAFVSERDGNAELYVMNADGSNPQRLTSSVSRDTDPAWSPDGRSIAFASNRDGDSEIYVMNADGTLPARLTALPGDDVQPAWSPDGNRLAFESRCPAALCGSGPIIHVMSATGRLPTWLTQGQQPTWSPDGRKIGYTSVLCDRFQYYYVNNCRTAEVRIIGVDGRGDVALLNTPASKPAWRR